MKKLSLLFFLLVLSSSVWTQTFQILNQPASTRGWVGNQLMTTYVEFPNPTTGIVNVAADGLQNVEVYDLLGNRILSSDNPCLNLESCPIGFYFVRIMTEYGICVEKVSLVR